MLVVLGLLGCASGRPHAALGWSLGGEAHVFVADDRFARDFYRQLTHNSDLMDTLAGQPLVAVDARNSSSLTVLSANGAAPARLTLARFLLPAGKPFAGIGITPHVYESRRESMRDYQFEAAMEQAARLLAMR